MTGSEYRLLSVRDLRLGFRQGAGYRQKILAAVDGVSFDVNAGETLALLGESGCGKSATALSLLRLLPSAGQILDGQVFFETTELLGLPEAEMRSVRGGGMAMIFQEPATSLNPVLTVGRQIGEVLERHRGLRGAEARAQALALLQAVGLADAERRLGEYPFQMSGGMKQRVMIAVALAGNPRLLIADEPTTALDVTIQAQILDLLRQLQVERQMGLLLITHDLGVVARMAHRVCVMYAGEIVEEAPRDVFFTAPRHPYTHKLFAALPDVAARGQALETIPGHVPSLGAMPSGCRFAERCGEVSARCREESPGWTDCGNGHRVRCHLAAEATFRRIRERDGSSVASPFSLPSVPLLEVSGLKVHFPIRHGVFRRTVGHVKAVDGVSLSIGRGRTLALVGESGCGKTTAGKALLRLIDPTEGRVLIDGRELTGLSRSALRPMRRKMQMVFQDPFASLNPRLPVGEIIAEGMTSLGIYESAADRSVAIDSLLQQVGLPAGAIHRYPHEFSGGQRQRIAIARVLAVQPDLIVCDEPTSALDVSVQAQILNLLKSLQNELGLAYLFITHNLAVVDYLAHDVAVMYLGRIVERGRVDEVLHSPRHPYTKALLSAVPSLRLEGGTVMRLAGDMPSPATPPNGCHFHPRCPQASAICRTDYPAQQPFSSSHQVNCHHA